MYEYNSSWPPELQEVERRRYRAECKVRCLEASLDRISMAEFDSVMNQIEAAQSELYSAALEALRLKCSFFSMPCMEEGES